MVIDGSPDRVAASASSSRHEVVDMLRASGDALDAATVAGRLGVHVTTARFHLERLVAAGLARRGAGIERRRGRPRVLYTAAEPAPDEDPREQLIHVLAATVAAQDGSGTESVRAGRRWARSIPPLADDPVSGLVGGLDRLGFDPETVGGQIRLHACPFRDAARDQSQVICSVHRGLIEQLLEPTGIRARLLPFVEPELCLVALEPAAQTQTGPDAAQTPR